MKEVRNPAPDAPPREGRFIIRGHHLQYLTTLIAPISVDPDVKAYVQRIDNVERRADTTEENINWTLLTEAKYLAPGYLSAYALDLVGDTEEQADAFEDTLARTFREFVTLGEDDEVLLTAKGLDRVCEACTFKTHCHAPVEAEEDAKYLDVFEDVLAFAQANDETSKLTASRLESGDIVTTAKSVRRVMGHFAIAKLYLNDLYQDALERREKYGNVFGGPDASDIEKFYDIYGAEII